MEFKKEVAGRNMSSNAVLKSNEALLWASDYSEIEWTEIKKSYSIGDYLMSCCGASAVPKTSPNGEQFFAHYAGECSTAPETKWHKTAKMLIRTALEMRSLHCYEEFHGCGRDGKKWIADTYFEFQNRKIAIEIQHSYQSLENYFRRQDAYASVGVECYWLLYKDRFLTVTGAMGKNRLKHEFNNEFPAKRSFYPCLKGIPVAYLDTELSPVVKGVAHFQSNLDAWIVSILEQNFVWSDGAWFIQGPA